MNRDCHLIFEAFTSPTRPTAAPVQNVPLDQALSKPAMPTSSAKPAEQAEVKEKSKTITITNVDTERKAIHAAYDVVELIYRVVDNFERATEIIQAIASVHKRERKRLKK
jgi:hypothetical protein